MYVKKHQSLIKASLSALSLLVLSNTYATTPLWTLTPAAGSSTTLNVLPTGTAVVQYVVQNQSNRAKNIVIQPIQGVTQAAPCQVALAVNVF